MVGVEYLLSMLLMLGWEDDGGRSVVIFGPFIHVVRWADVDCVSMLYLIVRR